MTKTLRVALIALSLTLPQATAASANPISFFNPFANPNACGWKTQSGATFSTGYSVLNAIAAQSATYVWAVGDFSPTSSGNAQPLAEFWNGTKWTISMPPQRNTLGNVLYGVAPLSSSQAWAVGSGAETTNVTLDRTLVELWNGTAWSIVNSPNLNGTMDSNDLFSVAAWGSTAAMAVGQTYFPKTNAFATLAERWNGSTWTIVPSPNMGTVQSYFNGVGGVSATNAWAVGGGYNGSRLVPISAHWNGSTWNLISVPAPTTTNNAYLYSVAAISPHDVWAVGFYNLNNLRLADTLAFHWNGVSWSMSPIKNVTGAIRNLLFSVSAVATNDVWAVGEYQMTTGGPLFTLAEHWNGTAWTIVSTQNPNSADDSFGAVSAANSTNVFAAGAQGAQGFGQNSLVEAYCR